MRVTRVTDIPHGGLAYMDTDPDGAPVLWVDAALVSDEQAAELARRLSAPGGNMGKFAAA
jgi:hypothetical protein